MKKSQSLLKNIGRRLAPVALSVALLLTAATPAMAVSSVNATLTPDRTIVVDGKAQTFYTVSGQEAHPLAYAGTTYLPVRSIGELMNKNVNWDNNSKTITLTGPRTSSSTTGTPDVDAKEATVTATLRDDFTIIVDGVVTQFYDANGNRVYPLLYNGVTYLPVRAVGELMGKVVGWNTATQTVTLSSTVDSFDSLVTDADSFETGTTGTTAGTTISAETAKSKALSHAGLTSSQVTFVQAKLDWDDGRAVYDVEFYTKDYKEYDYEIDASNGKILSYDYDADHYTRPTQPSTGSDIGLEKAKSIALGQVSGATSANIREAKRDYDDGRLEYEVKIIYNNYEYEFEINGTTGAIISRDVESIWD